MTRALAVSGQTISITVPPVTVVQAPPALVTRLNPEHVGLTHRELLEVLRDMRRHPRFAGEVVSRGKIRGATPAAILAFLREATPREASSPANDAAELDGVDAVLASIDYERTPPSAAKRVR